MRIMGFTACARGTRLAWRLAGSAGASPSRVAGGDIL